MKVIKLGELSKERYRAVMSRSAGNDPSILPQVKKIMAHVIENGDRTLIKYVKKWTGKKIKRVKVTRNEIEQAYRQVDLNLIKSLKQMINNITAVHKAQLPKLKEKTVKPERGISVWRVWRPIEKVGLYIPGGRAVYPSSVLMSAIPAKIAGCKEIVMCSPAGPHGRIPAPTLVAADLAGIKKIYKAGGAEAIAAMAYGTETIPKVDKIFGAGNAYVTAAKMLALETCAIDMPAGPSEVLIIADETAKPAFIAADLLADGEHGEDSACVLLTTSKQIAKQTIAEIEKQLRGLPTRPRVQKSLQKYGLIAITNSIDEAIEFSNKYAPEHLEIIGYPESILGRIQNAGSVFFGSFSPEAAGDYCSGPNHVLPTGRFSRTRSGLSVLDFIKVTTVQALTEYGLASLKETIISLALAENLPAHANSVIKRIDGD